jgi:tetratricopeptide (TPR) repeat protein
MTRRPKPKPDATPARGQPAAVDAFALALQRLAVVPPLRQPALRQIAASIGQNLLLLAKTDLEAYLAQRPEDPDALRLMAQVQMCLGRREASLVWLERCVAAAPGDAASRFNLVGLLFQDHRYEAALAELERLLQTDPRNPVFRQRKIDILERLGDGEQTLALCEGLSAEHPTRVESWIRYGHALRSMGRHDDCINAYRRAIALRPASGAAYWSLANLKTMRFDEADVAAMETQLQDSGIEADSRIPLQFALAKAYEDQGRYEQAFGLYDSANAAARARIQYDPRTLSDGVARNKALFTPDFLRSHEGAGAPSTAPIFILGRPRSGSTLVEQILSSHPAIEATAELPYITALASRLNPRPGPAYNADYLDALARLQPDELAALGQAYLADAGAHRRTERPYFTDKKPANFAHIGLIHLILPQARIIDVRRHPAACGLSMFKSYSSGGRLRLPELGRYYRDYVELLAHFDRVLPGRVLRVNYQDLVTEPEIEVRRMLDHLGLPFDPACLRFYETRRTMLTPSSEQVRRPLTRDAVDHWRHFEPWLAPLIDSLGSVFSAYPEVPDDLR